MELLTWTDKDIKHVAHEEGIKLNKGEVEAACEIAYGYLNENDALNSIIWNLILDAIKEVKNAAD